MKLALLICVLPLSLVVAASDALAAPMPQAKNPPKVFIDANRSRQTKVAGGDWDDRTQKVQIEIVVRNIDLNKKVDGLVLHYWTISQSMADRKVFKVLERGSFDVNLDGSPGGREVRHSGEQITLQWDDTGAKFGTAYKGYLLVLLNAANEVVSVKSNIPSWQTAFAKAFDLNKDAWCTLDFKPASAPRF